MAATLWSIGSPAAAQTAAAGTTLFQNVGIHDGTGKSLSAPLNARDQS